MKEIENNDTILPKPICYDAKRDKFITEKEVINGSEELITLETLTPDDIKKLVIARLQRADKGTTMQAISGIPYSPDEVIQAIEQDDDFGRMMIEAEMSYLKQRFEEISKLIK